MVARRAGRAGLNHNTVGTYICADLACSLYLRGLRRAVGGGRMPETLDEDARRDWAGPVTGVGTVNAFLRRLRSSLKPLRGIVRGDLPETPGRRVTTEHTQVTVVDLHNLPERAQRAAAIGTGAAAGLGLDLRWCSSWGS